MLQSSGIPTLPVNPMDKLHSRDPLVILLDHQCDILAGTTKTRTPANSAPHPKASFHLQDPSWSAGGANGTH